MSFKYKIGDLLVLPGLNPLYSLVVDVRIRDDLEPLPGYYSSQHDRGRQYLLLATNRIAPVWRLAFIIEKHYNLAVPWTTD